MKHFLWIPLYLSFMIASAFSANKDAYEIGYSLYGSNPKMRQETAYHVDASGNKIAIQSRIYVDDTNELREAGFLQANGKWSEYGIENLPPSLKSQIAIVNGLVDAGKNRHLATSQSHPPIDTALRPGEIGNPVLIKPTGEPSQELRLSGSSWFDRTVCEYTSPEIVVCNGVAYRRDRTGAIQDTSKSLKSATPPSNSAAPQADDWKFVLPSF